MCYLVRLRHNPQEDHKNELGIDPTGFCPFRAPCWLCLQLRLRSRTSAPSRACFQSAFVGLGSSAGSEQVNACFMFCCSFRPLLVTSERCAALETHGPCW